MKANNPCITATVAEALELLPGPDTVGAVLWPRGWGRGLTRMNHG